MIAPITSKVIKRVPYVGPVIQGVGIALDAKEILEISTPVGASKIIAGRFIKECSPPSLFLSGKCIMFIGGLVASFSTGGNPLVVSGTMSAARSIIKVYIILSFTFTTKTCLFSNLILVEGAKSIIRKFNISFTNE